MSLNIPRSILALSMFILAPVCVRAEVRLPAIIGDNMVLQQGMKARIWGNANAGENVTVTFSGKTLNTVAGADGRWQILLGPLEPVGPSELIVKGENILTIKNVLVGEVWICSGQSNMEWPLSRTTDATETVAQANHPEIRLFRVEHRISASPLTDVEGRWVVTTPEEAASFSAVGYFFGRELHQRLKVPIGLVHSSWGGTPAEAWTSREALSSAPELKAILDKPQTKEANQKDPSVLYNAMIAPLVPFAIRGAIWYQGESNATRAYQYRTLFPLMIRNWRSAWGHEFPFYFVQLANWRARKTEPDESDWAELREAQLWTLREPQTGMAVAVDIGAGDDLHPPNKLDVGRRLAAWALARTYRQHVAPSGPLFDRFTIEGNKIRISFKHASGLKTSDDGPVKGFAIAGADRRFVWADARIDGNTVVVSTPQIKKPVAVRYGWADNPEVNLYNNADLPASPFRTDDWPGVTAKSQ